MKRFLLLGLLVLAACSSQEPEEKRNVLRVSMQTGPLSLDPAVGADRRTQVVTRMFWEGLTRVGPEGKVELALAQAVEISPDGKVYTFHLRPSCWSDGTPCTAHDFEYAFKRLLQPDFPTTFSFLLFAVEGGEAAKMGEGSLDDVGVKALDDQTLVIRWAYPAPYFLDMLAGPVLAPIKRDLKEEWHKYPDTYVCNGPFRLAQFQPDSQIVAERNPHYWEADQVRLDGVNVAIVPDGNTMLQMFERGELDWAGEPMAELPKPAIASLVQKGELQSKPVTGVYGYNFNSSVVPFNSQKVRQAFSLALDRQELIDCVLKGNEPVATSLLAPQLSLCRGLDVKADPERARELFEEGLAELGLSREELPEITLSYSMLEGEVAMAQAVQQQWCAAFDIPVKLRGYEWRAYMTALLKHDYQVGAVTWWAIVSDASSNLETGCSIENAHNVWRWEDPVYAALFEAARQTVDREARRRLLEEAEELFLDAMVFAPVHVAAHKYAKRAEVEGVVLLELGGVDFRWAQKGGSPTSRSPLLPRAATHCAAALPGGRS